MAKNQKSVTDEQEDEQAEARLSELLEKETRTPEEETEAADLKEKRHGRFQKKIDRMKWETESEREKREAAEARITKLEAELAEEKKQKKTIVDPIENTVKIDGKDWYTDEYLQSLVDGKRMTEEAAWDHKRKREKAEIKAEVRDELRAGQVQQTEQQIRDADMNAVLEQYPQFHKDHPKFDKNDPLYVESSRIWNNGYKNSPKGMSLAVAEAKRILGHKANNEHIDLGEQFNAGNGGPAGEKKNEKKGEEVILNETEKTAAVRMWCDLTNPATKKNYTEAEAFAKAKKAKAERQSRRGING